MTSPSPQPEAIIAYRCRCYDSAEIYVKELTGVIDSCEFQMANPKVSATEETAAVVKKLDQAKMLLPLAVAEKERLRLVKLAELKEKVDQLERQIHDHIRQIESRVVMSKKEELAREATVEWLQEEVDKLEDKIHTLEHTVTDPECLSCIEMRKAAERHEAFRAAREANGVSDDSDY